MALAEADLAAHLRQELLGVVRERERLKERLGALDFVDLLSRTRDLLKSSRSVREQLQLRFTHLFIDEFQDTDPLQAEILMLLASDSPDATDYRELAASPASCSSSGDPKQAIYRFRARGRDALRADQDRALGARRSAPAFDHQLPFGAVHSGRSQHGLCASHGHLRRWQPSRVRRARRASPGASIAAGRDRAARARTLRDLVEAHQSRGSDSYPAAVGAFVEWLLQSSGWQVHDEGSLVPVKPRHVCLLFKRFQSYYGDTTRPMCNRWKRDASRTFWWAGAPFTIAKRSSRFGSRSRRFEWPDDEAQRVRLPARPACWPSATKSSCASVTNLGASSRSGASARLSAPSTPR